MVREMHAAGEEMGVYEYLSCSMLEGIEVIAKEALSGHRSLR
jgi:hypothetical protein